MSDMLPGEDVLEKLKVEPAGKRAKRRFINPAFWCVCKLCQGAVAGVSVEDERVRELLGRVNGIDMDVVFAPRKEPLVPPRYRLMTRDQGEW